MNTYAAAELVELLGKHGLLFSTAESCTGGLVAKLVTDVPGASNVFVGSVVAYSNEIKRTALNVPQKVLDEYGAVSHETVIAMAENIKHIFMADVAASVSGIAGPAGGTEAKPAGTVCFGFAFPNKTAALTEHFSGSRDDVRTSSALFVINYCTEYLRGYVNKRNKV
jgi:PncC family amidohydrolase